MVGLWSGYAWEQALTDGVEDGEDDLLDADGTRVEHGVAAPPREGNVGGAEGVRAQPALGFEFERGRRVYVRHEGAESRDGRDHGPVVARPDTNAARRE